MKSIFTKLFLLILIAAIVGGAWYMTKKRPLSVEVVSAQNNIAIKVFGLGTVEARILSKVGFKLSNAITELNVDEGDLVKKGDVLARLDNNEQLAKLARSRAGITAAMAAFKGAQTAIGKAKVVLAQKQRSYDRKNALFKKRTISTETLEASRLELDTAKAELAISKSNLLTAEAAVESAKAQLELDKVILDQHVLRAPYDAVIVTRHVEAGTITKAGEPIFTLVDPKSVWVLGHISESRSGLIKTGQDVEVRLRSRPHDLFKGKVIRVDIESDRVTEERQVYVSCGSCLEKFNLGEQAEVYITTAKLDKALLVPENAVDTFDERQMKGVVWVLADGKLKRQPVTFGHRTLDARLTIKSDLPDGVKVLARLPKTLKEGRSAKIAREKN